MTELSTALSHTFSQHKSTASMALGDLCRRGVLIGFLGYWVFVAIWISLMVVVCCGWIAICWWLLEHWIFVGRRCGVWWFGVGGRGVAWGLVVWCVGENLCFGDGVGKNLCLIHCIFCGWAWVLAWDVFGFVLRVWGVGEEKEKENIYFIKDSFHLSLILRKSCKWAYK